MQFMGTGPAFECLVIVFLTEDENASFMSTVDPPLKPAVRGIAGLILKNWIRQNRSHLTENHIALLRPALLPALATPFPMIRSAAVSVLSGLVGATGGRLLDDWWPGVLQEAVMVPGVGGIEAVEAVFEEHGELLIYSYESQLEALVGFLVDSLVKESGPVDAPRLRRLIGAVNHVIAYAPEWLPARLDALLVGLSQAGQHPSLRRVVCQALNLLVQAYSEHLKPFYPALLQYTFEVIKSASEDDAEATAAALEATEFWLGMADADGVLEGFLNHHEGMLGTLLDVLLRNMHYAPDSPELTDQDATINDGPDDRDTEMQPRFRQSSTSAGMGEEGELEEGELIPSENGNRRQEQDDYDWNLRKCSAATLDRLSTLELPMVQLLLDRLAVLLSSGNWQTVEVGMLALGAVSEGFGDALEVAMPQVLPILIEQIRSGQPPLLRSMAIWTSSRLASSHLLAPSLASAYMEAVLYAMIGPNKIVQRAACTALCRACEDHYLAMTLVKPVLPALLTAVVCAAKTYHRKNRVLLCDLIRTMAEELLSQLRSLDASPLVQVLLERLSSSLTQNASPAALIPLLEALAALALAIPPTTLSQAAMPALQMALQLAGSIVNAATSAGQDGLDDAEYDVAILSLDLIAGLLPALQGQPALAEAQPIIEGILARLFSPALLPVSQLRQSAFALIGDLATHGCLTLTAPLSASLLLDAIIADHRPTDSVSTSCANNAVWAAGCLASRLLTDALQALLERMVAVLIKDQAHAVRAAPSQHTYFDNMSVALGRIIGALQTSYGTAHLPGLLPALPLPFLCSRLLRLMDPEERTAGIIPILHLAMAEPTLDRQAAVALAKLLTGLQACIEPEDELNEPVRELSARISSAYPSLL